MINETLGESLTMVRSRGLCKRVMWRKKERQRGREERKRGGEERRGKYHLGLLKKKLKSRKKVQMDWRCAGKDKEEEEEGVRGSLHKGGIYDLWLRGTILSLEFEIPEVEMPSPSDTKLSC